MKFKIILTCSNKNDAERFDRILEMNSYEAASATFKILVKGALEDLVDPYVIEFYYGEYIRYKLESLNI